MKQLAAISHGSKSGWVEPGFLTPSLPPEVGELRAVEYTSTLLHVAQNFVQFFFTRDGCASLLLTATALNI
jgi:hypothetical protein